MTCSHPKETCVDRWCSVCGSLHQDGEWKLPARELALRTAGWVWENPTERFNEPALVLAIKLLPNQLSGIELTHVLRGARIFLHVNRRLQYVNELVANVLHEQGRTSWGYALGRPVLLLPGMTTEIRFEPPEFVWECRWLIRRVPPGDAVKYLSRLTPGSAEWLALQQEQLRGCCR